MRRAAYVLFLAGCSSSTVEIGAFSLTLDRSTGSLSVTHESRGEQLDELRLLAGSGSADVNMQYGSFDWQDLTEDIALSGGFGSVYDRVAPTLIDVTDERGASLGLLSISSPDPDLLVLDWSATAANRLGLSARCDDSDHFMGMGSHAMDVDHVGEAFPLWVSEPGIGKTESDTPPADWFFTGTKHASSFPAPWILRPHRAQGLLIESQARIDVDLCATDPERFEIKAWNNDSLRMVLILGDSPLDAVENLTVITGRLELPPPWVFAPWNDAVYGSDRVRDVAQTLRDAGAPSSVIWTEDWKGGEYGSFGYRLSGEWTLDESLYPDAVQLDAELEALGFKWFAYFAPFVEQDTTAWEEAIEADILVRNAEGEPYTFSNQRFVPTGLVDLSTSEGQVWAQERMNAALAIGFDGWMADFAEWLPYDAVLASREPADQVHNRYPEWWQETSAGVMTGDTSFFARSGWSRTTGLAPVVWAGDQRTSFDSDDGFPTVIPLGLGLAASGVPVFTHDVAGYNSIGNPPSDRELWFRWAGLGAFSPVLRTHHGAFADENWQFDTDEETLAHWTRMAREHMALFPYRYALAHRASEAGTPMILPTAFVFDGEPWDRVDAWMLGSGLLVAPVLERGAMGREISLPEATQWYDWWTLEPVTSGWFDASPEHTPVFAASGSTIPLYSEIPDTLVGDSEDLVTRTQAEQSRTVLFFDGGSAFVEADGTRYIPSGTPDGPGTATAILASGSVSVAGMTIDVIGSVEREYTFVVITP